MYIAKFRRQQGRKRVLAKLARGNQRKVQRTECLRIKGQEAAIMGGRECSIKNKKRQ